jgi:hypothetical protein
MQVKNSVSRAKLVDEPIVEMILSYKYFKSGIKFMKADLQSDFDGTDIIAYSNGSKQLINVKRNSSKYYNSSNFTLSVNKNKLDLYNNVLYIFIDEVANCLYLVNGKDLLKYILDKIDNVKQSAKKSNSYYIVIPKSDIRSMIGDNKDQIITYSSAIAKLFESGRDESIYSDLI